MNLSDVKAGDYLVCNRNVYPNDDAYYNNVVFLKYKWYKVVDVLPQDFAGYSFMIESEISVVRYNIPLKSVNNFGSSSLFTNLKEERIKKIKSIL